MASTEEKWISLKDGLKVYTKTWKPVGEHKASILFLHGFSDHCNSYNDFFATLTSKGIKVFSFDQRGWGLTCSSLPPAQRGLTGPTSLVNSDITEVLSTLLPSPVPFFLVGHSMGGGETLTYAALGPPDVLSQIRGYVCESPLIALHPYTQPSKVKYYSGLWASKVLPNMQLYQKLDSSKLCRDEVVQKEIENDPLVHNYGTLEGLGGMLERGMHLVNGESKMGKSVKSIWIGHGSSDLINHCEASKEWCQNCGVEDVEFKEYDGWSHRLHQEPGNDKFEFANDVADWILARSNNASSEVGAENEESKSRL